MWCEECERPMRVKGFNSEDITWECRDCGYLETKQKDAWEYISDMEKRYRKTENLLNAYENDRDDERMEDEENSALEQDFLDPFEDNHWLISG